MVGPVTSGQCSSFAHGQTVKESSRRHRAVHQSGLGGDGLDYARAGHRERAGVKRGGARRRRAVQGVIDGSAGRRGRDRDHNGIREHSTVG